LPPLSTSVPSTTTTYFGCLRPSLIGISDLHGKAREVVVVFEPIEE
jgi:hypothetical protein